MDPLLSRLASDLEGTLIDPGHAEYDRSRAIWNGAISSRPAAIARVGGTKDVATTLRLAREGGRSICVRCGGHGTPGHSVIDDAVVIDLGALRDVAVDAGGGVARVGGGALWSDVDRATAAAGRATTGGMISHTGVGGLTLGGGIGWLMRKHGLTIDNLTAAEVVLADGRVVSASADENEDLFWALRGGGGNFGVVTRFDFRLHPVTNVLAGLVMYPAARAGAMLRFFREITAEAADDLTALFSFLTAPPAPFIPAHLQGKPMVAIVVCWSGDLERGAAALRPVRSFGPPAVDAIAEMPYVALQSMLDPGAPHGWQYYMKAAYFDELTDATIDGLVEHAAAATSPLTQVHVHHLGGAVARVDSRATAYRPRRAAYLVNVPTAWLDAGTSDVHVAWARALYDAIAGQSNGAAYVNFLGEEGDARVRSAYGDNYARLAQIKRAYDPHNVFRHNQNILPAPV
jgi:FAD/FMN-containing dehydrogenase